MTEIVKLRKGLDIKLLGKPEQVIGTVPQNKTFAIKPVDFQGLTPKLVVKSGQLVKKGEVLFYDKYYPEIVFTSPVGGTVVSINRGERRRILEVVVKEDKNEDSISFLKGDPLKMNPEEIKENILASGLWPFIKRRPYGIIARPHETPKNIFISAFDTAPLAPDYDFIVLGQEKDFQTGINALSRLTEGMVHLGTRKKKGNFDGIENVHYSVFEGAHPAGNVGVQIHHISPISKGDVIWTINPQDVIFIGRLFNNGALDMNKIVALTGSEVTKPCYYKMKVGSAISFLINKSVESENKYRIISGNVLTGSEIESNNFLGFYDSQITVIPEGDQYEFMGWATLGMNKFSAGNTFFSKIFPQKAYKLDANMHGGERAFVMTGQYEKYLPMDILPVYLLKSIIVNDIDKMEQLGIYEVIEEDLALCEFACTSKIKVQDLLKKGIESIIREMG